MNRRRRYSGSGVAAQRLGAVLLLGAALVPGAALARPAVPAPTTPITAAPVRAAAPPADTLPASRVLRISVATQGLSTQALEPATISVTAGAGGTPGRARFSVREVPADVTIDFDLPRGVIRAAGRRVGSFTPVDSLTDNLKFPVDIAIRRGATTITVHRDITLLLPTVIVPGFSNDERTQPDELVMSTFARYGYTVAAALPTLFWYPYQPHAIGLDGGAKALAAYVRRVVLPATHAARINVVGYSVGGLLARWNAVYDIDGWSGLVNRLVLVAVPNDGAVMPYLVAHAPRFFPFVGTSKTPLARAMDPAFPFWRPTAAAPWSIPPDGRNQLLAGLNARPTPPGIRVYLFYGNNDPARTGGPQTASGITGQWPEAVLSYGPGDGVVLTASALGLPINASAGVPGLADHAVQSVDLGRIYHTRLLQVAAAPIAAALQDRFETAAEAAGIPQSTPPPH